MIRRYMCNICVIFHFNMKHYVSEPVTCRLQIGQFRPLKLTFSNNGQYAGMQPLHMQVKSEFLKLLLKKQANRLHS